MIIIVFITCFFIVCPNSALTKVPRRIVWFYLHLIICFYLRFPRLLFFCGCPVAGLPHSYLRVMSRISSLFYQPGF
ncbi:hypothetical protein A8C56_19335 [Niabella ginsenosidivorans]|uniref:Uncharacterized protein n=1 Tax=Niabella ginsenosidivorans TaxID=1176587 RepID=A0A1A9I838_9BACT|nr:hypothetical protein A8C56_19335 [Niabella ginsenosidivorans]